VLIRHVKHWRTGDKISSVVTVARIELVTLLVTTPLRRYVCDIDTTQ